MIFCPVKHVGRHHFLKGKNYVVTLNHNTLADVPVSSPGIPGPNRTLAKIEMASIPIFGYIYKADLYWSPDKMHKVEKIVSLK